MSPPPLYARHEFNKAWCKWNISLSLRIHQQLKKTKLFPTCIVVYQINSCFCIWIINSLLRYWEIWKHLRRSAWAPTPAPPERSRGPSRHRRRRRPPPSRWCCRGRSPPACSRRWPPARSPHRPPTPAPSPAAAPPTLCVESTQLHCLLHTLIISCHRSWHEYKRCEL